MSQLRTVEILPICPNYPLQGPPEAMELRALPKIISSFSTAISFSTAAVTHSSQIDLSPFFLPLFPNCFLFFPPGSGELARRILFFKKKHNLCVLSFCLLRWVYYKKTNTFSSPFKFSVQFSILKGLKLKKNVCRVQPNSTL